MTLALVLALGGAHGQAAAAYQTVPGSPLATRFDALIAGVDFSGSGQTGVLIGGDLRLSSGCTAPDQRPLAARIRAMASQGDGSFRDVSGDVIVARPDAFLNPVTPIELIADFNGDGRPDIVIFDYGVECVFDPNTPGAHTFVGFPPILLLSGPDGRWHASTALADAIARLHASTGFSGNRLRVLGASAADIDGNGTIDLWVERCGSNANACSHFLLNNGDGTFTADPDLIPYEALHGPSPRFWRHAGSALVDGNGDGRPDLVLTHRRNGPNPLEPDASHHGRYSQVLMNKGNGLFVDETASRWADQSLEAAQVSATTPPDRLNNQVWRMFAADFNGDGLQDIVLGSRTYIRRESPLVYVNDGNGRFTALDPTRFTGSDNYFGEGAMPLDLNGDGVADVLHADLLPGADGAYGTGDELVRLIASIAQGAAGRKPEPPRHVNAQVAHAEVKLAWLAPPFGPRPGGYQLEVGTAPGLSDLVNVRLSTTATAMTFAGVPQGRYFVRLRSALDAQLSQPSAELAVRVGGACGQAPSAPSLAHFVDGNTVNFSWTGSPTATWFLLEAGLAAGASDHLLPTDTARVLVLSLRDVPPGNYFVRLRGRNSCGLGGASSEIAVTVPPRASGSRPSR